MKRKRKTNNHRRKLDGDSPKPIENPQVTKHKRIGAQVSFDNKPIYIIGCAGGVLISVIIPAAPNLHVYSIDRE